MKNFNLTPRAQKAIKDASAIAAKNNNKEINCLHVFLALVNSKQNQIEEAFAQFDIDTDTLKNDIVDFLVNKYFSNQKVNSTPLLSAETKNLLKNAKELSNKYDHKFVGIEHIFISLFNSTSGNESFNNFLSSIDENKFKDLEQVFDYVEECLGQDDLNSIKQLASQIHQPIVRQNNKKLLSQYSICLNDQVINGKINNLHINNSAIQKISEVLCRKNKNNPLLIGEAGVGKTALVESLAQVIVQSQCSDFLLLKRIYALDIPMIVSGCKYRGEFEEKIKNILKEAVSDQNIVLFIDEIHTIIGAGNPENGMDIANILKPYLARGEISCIGATTFDEYKKTIAQDPALTRRFQVIKVEEPSKEQTYDLIKNIKHSYESFHFVKYSDDIIKYMIEMADRYLPGKFPDKVLDIIDQTGASIKLDIFKRTPEMIKLENRIKNESEKSSGQNQAETVKNIEELFRKYEKAAIKMTSKRQKNKYNVQEKDVLNVISNKTNIPIEELSKQDFEKLKTTKSELEKEIVGQNSQIEQIYKCLLRAKAGFRNSKKPIASFLFAGPTGVGKTFTCKIIANKLYSNASSFISVDMSEYADKTAINKLIGSNPGYIGYDKGGVLTEKVKKNPYSIILFDEIQKADPDVLFTLLQILEEGKLNDSYGGVIDFSNCVVIMTTNVGAEVATSSVMGFNSKTSHIQNDIFNSLKKYFPPDFLNRIDEIIIFNKLEEANIKIIIKKELDKIISNLENKNVKVNYSEDLIDLLYKKIQLNNFGARQVDKTLQREVQTIIAEKILENKNIDKINLVISNDQILCNT